MDETNGLSLLEKLKKDTDCFFNNDKIDNQYQLLEAYFDGLSKDTLSDLLRCKDLRIRQLAMWIISELGRPSKKLFKEVVHQMNDSDPLICHYAADIVACYAKENEMDDFIRVFYLFENKNPEIRRLSMFVISKTSNSRLQKAYEYSVKNNILSFEHEKGILFLRHINSSNASDIIALINSDDTIIRKYGIIAAAKVYEKYPEIIKEAVNSEDLDIQNFSKYEEQSRVASAGRLNN